MSNRNTKVYDNLIINSSTTNENDLCNSLNLPHNGNNQCVDDTKYYIKTSDNIINNSSNTDCSIKKDSPSERKL